MNRIRLVGLALMAVCAISVTTAGSASASVFLSTVAGKLLAKALATQTFHTHAGNVECNTLAVSSGEVTSLKALKQKATISYTGCKAFGLTATISPAEYEFNADGTVAVLKPITIKATGCLVTVPTQTVGPVKYLNKPAGEIEIEPNVTNITSSGSGVACEYETESVGTYVGNSLVAVEGGKLTWDA